MTYDERTQYLSRSDQLPTTHRSPSTGETVHNDSLCRGLVNYLPRDGLPVEVLVGRRLVARPVHLFWGVSFRFEGLGDCAL